jgi:hypothetical protein
MAKSDWLTRPLDDEWGEILRAELLSWPQVTGRPMMGALTFFHKKQMLGCYVSRALSKAKPEWFNRRDEPTFAIVRLRAEDAERALKRKTVRASRLGFDGWVEIDLSSRRTLEEAVRWFGTAYENPPPNKSKKRKKKSQKKARKKTVKRKSRR